MIPKRIHWVWLGQAPLSDLNRMCLESWRRNLPDFEIKEWTEANVPLDTPFTRAARVSGQWSRLSNMFRLHVLHAEGGVYLDTDVEVVRDFTPLLDARCFLGFQQRRKEADWVNNAVVGAEAGHPFLRQCMNLIERRFAETGELPRGPWVITKALRDLGLQDYGLQERAGVTIHPFEHFYPFPWYGSFSPACVRDETYAIHHWEGTWMKPSPYLMALRAVKRTLDALESSGDRTRRPHPKP